MILYLRAQMQKPWFKSVVWGSLTALMLLSLAPELVRRLGGAGGSWVMRVNGNTLDQQEFGAAVQRKLLLLRMRMGPYADQILQQLTPRILGDVIAQDMAIQKTARQMGLVVSDEFVATRLPQDIPAAGKSMMTDIVRDEVAQEVVISCSSAAVTIPEWMITNELNRTYAQRKCIVATVDKSTLEQQILKRGITDSVLEQFYAKANKESKKYWTQQQRSAVIYEFAPAVYGIAVSDKELETAYNKEKYTKYVSTPASMHLRKIVLPGDEQGATSNYAQAVQLAQELQKDPGSFEKIAAQRSLDKKADLGFVTKESLEPAIGQAAFALAADGAVSNVIKLNDKKYVIVQRVAKKNAQYKPLADVTADIKKQLVEQKFAKQFANDVKRATLGSDKAELLKRFAEKHKGSPKEITKVSNDNSSMHRKLFGTPAKGVGAYTEANKGYALIVTDIVQAVQQPFAKIKSQVQADYVAQQALVEMEQLLKAVANNPKGVAEGAKQHNLTTMTTPLMSPAEGKTTSEVYKSIGKAATRCNELNVIGQTAIEIEGNKGYVLQALEIIAPAQDIIQKHQLTTQGQLLSEQKRLAEGFFVEKMVKAAKIEFNNNVIS